MTDGKQAVLWTKAFIKYFDKALDNYPRSREDVRELVDGLPATHQRGDTYPDITPQVKKMRLPLQKYKIGTSGGLRLIFMLVNQLFLPIFIYAKRHVYKEAAVKKSIKIAQREILDELRETSRAEETEQFHP